MASVNASAPELIPTSEVTVGEMLVRRALPTRLRRTIGAWCFLDHFGPAEVAQNRGLRVGPHPHIGLQTVTWLLSGEVLHRDGTRPPRTLARWSGMTDRGWRRRCRRGR